MKHLVIHRMGNNKTAFCFDDRDDAVDYIDSCSECAGNNMRVLKYIDDDNYTMILKNGVEIDVSIVEYPDASVRFDLAYTDNGRYVETRRFTKRHLAVNYANKLLDEKYDCFADENEDELGEWVVDEPEDDVSAHLLLSLVILSKKESSDYDTLGVKSTASDEEIKQAFRKMALKNHPDRGGDPKKFQKIHEAYERITNGAASGSKKQKVLEFYGCMDMRCFFETLGDVDTRIETINPVLKSKLNVVRSEAKNDIFTGLVLTLMGGVILAAMSSNPNPSSFFIAFLVVLIISGILSFLSGMYYYVNPEAKIKKTGV